MSAMLLPDTEEVLAIVAESTTLIGGQPMHVIGCRPTSPLAEAEIVFQYGVHYREIAVGSVAAARAYALSILRACEAAEQVTV